MEQTQKYRQNPDQILRLSKGFYQEYGTLLKWSPEAESILDLGIGDGKMTKEVIFPLIPGSIHEFIGGDISENALKSVKDVIDHEKFQALYIDATTKILPEELKNRFHHIFSNYMFHHIQDVRQTLINIQEMLKPGGQLFFLTFEKIPADEAYDTLDQGKWSTYKNLKGNSPFYRSENPKKEYERTIESLGYVDCHIFTEVFSLLVPEGFIENVLTASNIRLPLVDEEDREEYLRDFLEAAKNGSMLKIISEGKSNSKVFEVTFSVIVGVISKSL